MRTQCCIRRGEIRKKRTRIAKVSPSSACVWCNVIQFTPLIQWMDTDRLSLQLYQLGRDEGGSLSLDHMFLSLCRFIVC